LLPGPALFQADLDCQKADVDQKIQQYIGTSQGPSFKLDKAFIMPIEIAATVSNAHHGGEDDSEGDLDDDDDKDEDYEDDGDIEMDEDDKDDVEMDEDSDKEDENKEVIFAATAYQCFATANLPPPGRSVDQSWCNQIAPHAWNAG